MKRIREDRPLTGAEYAKRHRERHPRARRAERYPREYGITLEQYEERLEEQGGVCAVCRRPETRVTKGTPDSLSVDHDRRCCPGKRSCGRCVRGLLCGACNRALGLLNDNVERIRAAADYVESQAR